MHLMNRCALLCVILRNMMRAYQKLNELIQYQYPERLDESAIQSQVVNPVRSQLISCARSVGSVLEHNESIRATTHSPGFLLDLVHDKKTKQEI